MTQHHAMKLGINVVRLTRPFTGVGRYIECLLNEWASMSLPFEEVVLYSPAPIRTDLALFPSEAFRTEIIGRPLPDPVWESLYLRKVHTECDVLFCPSYTLPVGYKGLTAVTYHGQALFSRLGPKALRGAMHDVLHRYSARNADCVFTVSQAVKDRVVTAYGVPQERVVVSHLAPSEAFRRILDTDRRSAVSQKYLGTDDPFILFVGKLSDRHFIPELLEAFRDTLRRLALPHRILLVGPDALSPSVNEIVRRLNLEDRVIHIPFIPHLELPLVYNAAEFFVYPASSVEGFGIPVLEAMACGTPVISTDQGSISEFAQGSALLVENSTVPELSTAIERLATDPVLREDLRRHGLATANRFKWRVTAEQTMNRLWETAQRIGPRR